MIMLMQFVFPLGFIQHQELTFYAKLDVKMELKRTDFSPEKKRVQVPKFSEGRTSVFHTKSVPLHTLFHSQFQVL